MFLLSILSIMSSAFAAENDLELIHRIKAEAFDNSKVMETLSNLTDLYGPRLTASPEFDQAAEWAMGRLKQYGVANVHGEKWGPFGRSWSLESYFLEMTSPRYSHLIAAPLAWSSSTEGVQTGEVVVAPFRFENNFDIGKNRESLERYKQQWRGKVKGRIVLVSDLPQPKPSEGILFRRYTDADLANLASAPEPSVRRNIPLDQIQIPSDPDEARKYLAALSPSTRDDLFDAYRELNREQAKFYRDEGALAILRGDARAHNGLLFAEQAGSEKSKDPLAAPTFVVTQEQYSRIARLAGSGQKVTLRSELKAKISDHDLDGTNIVGEIPGNRKPQEIVMIGAHFDSWHTGTGATDNGAGSAVMIEVMRILKTLNVKLDRTVRIGLWSGEEQGLLGSKAYVKEHLSDPKTMERRAEYSSFDAYLNLDNGSGKIRGIYLEDNDSAKPVFEQWLHPFHDLGVTTMTLKRTGGTDHLSFDAVGLPAFQFIQDPLDYGTATHHSDVDTFSHAIPEDLMQASAVIAALVCDISNREEQFPRKPVVTTAK